jgi:hypothetical protein
VCHGGAMAPESHWQRFHRHKCRLAIPACQVVPAAG